VKSFDASYSLETPRSDLVAAVERARLELQSQRKPSVGLIGFYASLLQLLDRMDDKIAKEKKHASKSN